MGLHALPPGQMFHAYINAGMHSGEQLEDQLCCNKQVLLVVLPMRSWYTELTMHHPCYDISIKTFYDMLLIPISIAEQPNFADIFTWWRHATTSNAAPSWSGCL